MRSVATLCARRLRDWPGSFVASPSGGGVYPITYPAEPLKLRVELLLGGVWIDVTTGADGVAYEPRIKITRGRANESSRATPSSCKVRLKNPNRLWSPRNWLGTYYGKLGRNVKLRVSVNPGDRWYTRFTGFIAGWPQQWTTGQHRWVEIQANGILRRLSKGKSPLKAPMFRAITVQDPYAYWPLTDVSGSTTAASWKADVLDATITGNSALGGTSDTPDGTPAFVVNAGLMHGSIPSDHAFTDGWTFGFAMKSVQIPAAIQPVFEPMITFYTDSDDVARWEILAPEADGGFPTEIDVASWNGTLIAALIGDPEPSAEEYDNQWHYYQIVASRVSNTLDVTTYYDGTQVYNTSIPLGLPTAGRITSFQINPSLYDWATSDLNLSFQHISVSTRTTVNSVVNGITYSDSSAFFGYVGESPTDRFRRLNTEEGIPFVIVEAEPDTETMGPQGIKPFLDLIRECEATNEGVLDETVDAELRLISRSAFWNQPPTMVIDYTSGAIKEGFLPTDDDLFIVNDWTITRDGGNSRQHRQTTGPLSINEPEDSEPGVGKYDNSATLSLETDDQAFQHAALRVLRGTVDEIRVSVMPLHFASSPELLPQWLKMDLADTCGFRIINTPADIGSLPANQNMLGYSETIDRLEWRVDINGAPNSNEQFGVLDTYGYLDCSASFLAETLDTTETEIDVAISDACVWVHTSGDYRITIRDEEMLVTAVSIPVGSGESWTQTLTVVRSVNGVVSSHPSNTRVRVTEPFIPALNGGTRVTMPTFGAGLRAYGADFMALADAINTINSKISVGSQSAADATLRTTTSTTYTTTLTAANILGVTFVAPPSGIVGVAFGCRLANSVNGNFTSASFQIATGSVIGSGTSFLAASDDRAVTTDGNVFEGQSRFIRVTGLTAGATYNVAMYHRTTSGTASFGARDIAVIPLTA